LRAYNAAKCDCGWGSLQRSSRPLAGFKGATSRRGGEGKGKGQRSREGGEEEVDSDVQLEQGRQLAKAGPGSLLLY